MKTDPKNSDYTVESGASRNYEPWRDKATQEEEAEREREEEEEGDAMKALENRTKESKREMDIMAALDEMRSLNARNAKVSLNDALGAIHGKIDAERRRAEEAEEAQAKAGPRRRRRRRRGSCAGWSRTATATARGRSVQGWARATSSRRVRPAQGGQARVWRRRLPKPKPKLVVRPRRCPSRRRRRSRRSRKMGRTAAGAGWGCWGITAARGRQPMMDDA